MNQTETNRSETLYGFVLLGGFEAILAAMCVVLSFLTGRRVSIKKLWIGSNLLVIALGAIAFAWLAGQEDEHDY